MSSPCDDPDDYEDEDDGGEDVAGHRWLDDPDCDDRALLYEREPTEDEILDSRGRFDGWYR